MGNTAKETESMEQPDLPSFTLDAVRCKKEAASRTGILACLRSNGHLPSPFVLAASRRAGPYPILWLVNQASRYRIIVDVPHDSLLSAESLTQ
jgi:hypothetical protein